MNPTVAFAVLVVFAAVKKHTVAALIARAKMVFGNDDLFFHDVSPFICFVEYTGDRLQSPLLLQCKVLSETL